MNQAHSACPFCRRQSAIYFRARDYNRRLSTEFFNYFRCPACGLIFLDPIPADLGKFYPSDYYAIPASVADLEAGLPGVRYKMEIIKRFAQSGRFLEIGPACGDLALQAKQAGFEVDTMEMDPRCCEFLVKHIGVRAVCTVDSVAALREAATTYDVIAMWHVIEHLIDVREMVAAAAARLNPGGILVMAAPNPESFQFRILGKRWAHVDAPRHVRLIPLALLTEQAKKHGLTLVWSTTDDEGARGWNKFGWEQSLGNLASGDWVKRKLRGLGRSVARRMARWDRREGRGSAYTVVYRQEVQK
jgi:2-polyprenyl-3-methyl-5-hydroxy-6-metoxy-1,4-benzoquinol methylase